MPSSSQQSGSQALSIDCFIRAPRKGDHIPSYYGPLLIRLIEIATQITYLPLRQNSNLVEPKTGDLTKALEDLEAVFPYSYDPNNSELPGFEQHALDRIKAFVEGNIALVNSIEQHQKYEEACTSAARSAKTRAKTTVRSERPCNSGFNLSLPEPETPSKSFLWNYGAAFTQLIEAGANLLPWMTLDSSMRCPTDTIRALKQRLLSLQAEVPAFRSAEYHEFELNATELRALNTAALFALKATEIVRNAQVYSETSGGINDLNDRPDPPRYEELDVHEGNLSEREGRATLCPKWCKLTATRLAVYAILIWLSGVGLTACALCCLSATKTILW